MSTLGTTAVIFDLDGTLVDSEPNYYEASRRTLAAYAAGMRCVAIPYLAAQADDPGFAAAGLLGRGGQREFMARAAFEWLVGTAGQNG